jgi:hypothetical protein
MKERSRRGGQSTRSVNREMRGPAEVVAPAGEDDISYAVPEGSIVIFARAAFLSALLLLAIGLPAGAQGAWAAVRLGRWVPECVAWRDCRKPDIFRSAVEASAEYPGLD